jgi:hypothetical protein
VHSHAGALERGEVTLDLPQSGMGTVPTRERRNEVIAGHTAGFFHSREEARS